MEKRKLYVVISDAYWDDKYWASRHYIPKHLADNKNNIVVFVERACSLISPIFYDDAPVSKVLQSNNLKQQTENLYTLHPYARLPFDRRYQFLSDFNQNRLLKGIEKTLVKFENQYDELIIVSFDHRAHKILTKYKGKAKLVYYVVDEISEFNWPMSSKEQVLIEEQKTIELADVVITTSNQLSEKVKNYNDNYFVVSHGVDIDLYLDSNISEDVQEIFKTFKKPIIGFVGKIEEWVDLELIKYLANERKDYSFVIVGPTNVPLDAIQGISNIHILGAVPKKEVANYNKMFDVALIPFLNNDLVKSVNPLKLYEYLAAGKPVVSSFMEAVLGFEHLDVLVANNYDEFLMSVDKVLGENTEQKILDRIQFAKSISWKARAEFVESNLEKYQSK